MLEDPGSTAGAEGLEADCAWTLMEVAKAAATSSEGAILRIVFMRILLSVWVIC
jgi:hypothetical protein